MKIDPRILRMEERLTWLQQHVTEQDKVINSLSVEINKLTKALLALKKQMPEIPDGNDATGQERPPHY